MSNFLTRDQILQASDLKIETVDVPEWGGKVGVRSITAIERSQLESLIVEVDGRGRTKKLRMEELRARLLCLAVVDEKGNRLFMHETDVAKVGAKSAQAVERVFDVARRLAGMSEDDVEALAKN